MRRLAACLVLVALLAAARVQPAGAWGFDAHQAIAGQAIALLPAGIRPLFTAQRASFVERSIDPDTWLWAGFDDLEATNHFLDIDSDGYGTYPFAELPRDYAAAIAKFGKARVDRNGRLPWRVEEVFHNLRRAFEAYPRRGPFGRFDVIAQAGWLAHYVSDAHQPFHAVTNYDGQLTGQHGIHVRYEASLFERYRDRLTLAPAARPPVTDPRGATFEALLSGSQLVPAILAADRAAIGTRDEYDDAYYAALFVAAKDVMERRLNDAIAMTAAMIAGAWEAAGSPSVRLDVTAPPQRRRR